MHKYAVGDWMYGDQPGEFWRVTAQVDMVVETDGPGYFIAEMRDKGDDRGFLFLRNLSVTISEKDLKPISGIYDTLLCLIAQLKENREDLMREADSIDGQIEDVIEVRDLLKKRG